MTLASALLGLPGAVPADAPDEGVAQHYGDPFAEQRRCVEAAGIVDRSNRDVLVVTGPDRLRWLHSLTTAHVEALPAGMAVEALLLSPHGHVEQDMWLANTADQTWIDVEPGMGESLFAFLDGMRFTLRVRLERRPDTAVLSLLGPAAGPVLRGIGAPEVAVDGVAERDGVLVRGRPGGIDLLVARADLLTVVKDALGHGAALAGTWAYEALRVAEGRPRLGWDTDHRTIPHEVGWIGGAVHLEKGCYRGQETVARVENLGRPPRRLVLLHLDGSGDRLPAHGDPVEFTGAVVGVVGTPARHYELGPIALALVKRTLPAGALVAVGDVPAMVHDLPGLPPTGSAATKRPVLARGLRPGSAGEVARR